MENYSQWKLDDLLKKEIYNLMLLILTITKNSYSYEYKISR